ncbi:MAG: ABC transporter substrate-binding protein, partial [Patescibacteria group bacterium]
TYTYTDKVISVAAFGVFLLMIVKMMLFPYGLFGFGENNIYTEGLVAKNGIQNINPLFVDYNEADREISRLVFSGLMKYDPEKKAVVDDMANLTVSEDKKQYTFKMRDGLNWHDGQSVTVDDVYFTFHDLVMSPAFPNGIMKTNFTGVKIEKIDDKTIQFMLDKPNVFFISNFLTGILPQHILKDINPADILQNDFNKKPVGSGPYMITEPVEVFSDDRTQITLERNINYYSERPEIELMRFIVYPTMDDLLDQIDAVNGVVKVSGKSIFDFVENDRFKLLPYKLPQYTAVFMNMESKILKDNMNVRLALQKAIDKKALIGQDADKVQIDTPLMELNQDEWTYQPDTDQANGALKDAGYEYNAEDKNNEGIRYDKDENALELTLIARLYDEGTYQFEETKETVSFLVSEWRKIGFNIQIEFLPLELFNEKISKREYDLLLVGQNLGYNLDTYSYWHSTQAGPLGQNFANYKSFQVDSLIEGIRSTFDPEERELKLKQLAKKLKEDIPAIFLYAPVYYYASDGKVSGINTDGVVFPSDRFVNVALWKLNY